MIDSKTIQLLYDRVMQPSPKPVYRIEKETLEQYRKRQARGAAFCTICGGTRHCDTCGNPAEDDQPDFENGYVVNGNRVDIVSDGRVTASMNVETFKKMTKGKSPTK